MTTKANTKPLGKTKTNIIETILRSHTNGRWKLVRNRNGKPCAEEKNKTYDQLQLQVEPKTR